MIHPPSPNSSFLVLPRRDFAVTLTRLLPDCASYLLFTSSSIERSHNETNIVLTFFACEKFELRRIELPKIMFYLLLSPPLYTLKSSTMSLTMTFTAMVALSAVTFQPLEQLLVVLGLHSLSMKAVGMPMMLIMKCTTSALAMMTC